MRQSVALASLAVLLGAAGCVPLYFAYPTVSYIPEVPLEVTGPVQWHAEDQTPIHTFRVDVRDDQNTVEFPDEDRYVLREVDAAVHYDSWIQTGNPMSHTGHTYVPAQFKVGMDTGMYWNCIALIYEKHTHHTMRLRLYRAGYQLAEIKPGDAVVPFHDWTKAADAAGQEAALDDLLSTKATDFQPWAGKESVTAAMRNLALGSVSPEHAKALRFAADEYERVARIDPSQEALVLRCRRKAAWLRERAEQ